MRCFCYSLFIKFRNRWPESESKRQQALKSGMDTSAKFSAIFKEEEICDIDPSEKEAFLNP